MHEQLLVFRCPKCDTETVIDESYLGQSGPCVNCGRVVTVPARETAGLPTDDRVPIRSMSRLPRRSLVTRFGLQITIGATAILLTMVGAVLLRAYMIQRNDALSRKNLQQIVIALRAYHTQHGTFPPAYVQDANGKKLCSWRVLILPQLGYKGLYDQYHFDEAWNSPRNATVLSQIPDVFRAPGGRSNRFQTSYLVIVDKSGVFTGGTPKSLGDIQDILSETILVVEARKSEISWTEPDDLDGLKMPMTINAPEGIIGDHPDHALVGMADGSVQAIPTKTTATELRQLISIQGGSLEN